MTVDLKFSGQENTGSLWTKNARRYWKRKIEDWSTRSRELSSFNSFKTLQLCGQMWWGPVARPLEMELTYLFPLKAARLLLQVDQCEKCICYPPPQVSVAQSCPTLCDPTDSVARQAPLSMKFSRQEYWSGCHSLSRVSFCPRDRTWISRFASRFLTICVSREALLPPQEAFRWVAEEGPECLPSPRKSPE